VPDDSPELNGVAFNFGQGFSKHRLLLALGEGLLQQAPKAVLLPLNPEKVLNLLPRARAWNLCIQKRTT